LILLKKSSLICFLATSKPKNAREFYKKTVGLKFSSEDQFALVFDVNATMLRIQKVQRFVPPEHTVLGWHVSDIQAEVARLSKRGVRFSRYRWMDQDEKGIWTSPSGAKVAWFKDPDGKILSLTQFE
jgi:predicted enzyme related to lactoylglutathione lyase